MPVTEALLTTCRTAIERDPALAAFRAAYAAFDRAGPADKGAHWRLAFDDAQPDLSPAYRLKRAVREAVANAADATVTAAEREDAYRTLRAQYVPDVAEPRERAEEVAELNRLIQEDQGS